MNTRAFWSTHAGLLVAVTMLASGCASTGTRTVPLPLAKTLQPADLASLAGEWQGTWRSARGASPAGAGLFLSGSVTFTPDGAYTATVSGVPGTGRTRVENGKLVFVGPATRGTATLHEGDGRRVLRGVGTWAGFDGNTEFELTKR